MGAWGCGIIDCGHSFETARALLIHQHDDHDESTCWICGDTVPAGYFAIKHAFTEHSRAEYVRAYRAEPAEIRKRDEILREVDRTVDIVQLSEEAPSISVHS